MKKTYIAPAMEIAASAASEIICASVAFGNGETDVMHSEEREFFNEDELSIF